MAMCVLFMFLVSLLAANHTAEGRDLAAHKSLTDQKTTVVSGIGGYSGTGDNGIPYGGIGSVVGNDGGNGGFNGLGGIIGTGPNGNAFAGIATPSGFIGPGSTPSIFPGSTPGVLPGVGSGGLPGAGNLPGVLPSIGSGSGFPGVLPSVGSSIPGVGGAGAGSVPSP